MENINDKTPNSVEWFWLNLTDDLIGDLPPEKISKIYELAQQAKIMHKEEHRKTYYQGLRSNFHDFYGYYIETFGGNNE